MNRSKRSLFQRVLRNILYTRTNRIDSWRFVSQHELLAACGRLRVVEQDVVTLNALLILIGYGQIE